MHGQLEDDTAGMSTSIASDSIGLGSIEEERQHRLASREIEADAVDRMLEDALAPYAGTLLARQAREAWAFASNIDYHHTGLSTASYLAHPVRVAALTLKLMRPPHEMGLSLALLHNVFELSDVRPDEISGRFGQPIADAIRVLTVDRTQKSRGYTVAYYRKLHDMPSYVRIVKALDKLDNMFVLCLNPSEDVRTQYLEDIETFVRPMVAAELPHLLPYFDNLIDDCWRCDRRGDRK